MTETLELKDIAKLMKKEMKVKYPDIKISAKTKNGFIWVTLFLTRIEKEIPYPL